METQGEPLMNLDSNDHWDQEERVLIISRTKRLIGSDLAANDNMDWKSALKFHSHLSLFVS